MQQKSALKKSELWVNRLNSVNRLVTRLEFDRLEPRDSYFSADNSSLYEDSRSKRGFSAAPHTHLRLQQLHTRTHPPPLWRSVWTANTRRRNSAARSLHTTQGAHLVQAADFLRRVDDLPAAGALGVHPPQLPAGSPPLGERAEQLPVCATDSPASSRWDAPKAATPSTYPGKGARCGGGSAPCSPAQRASVRTEGCLMLRWEKASGA